MDLDALVEALRADPRNTGFFVDFDGTLAPIVPEPADARIVPGGGDVLQALANRYRVVAMISGRAAADLQRRVGARGPRYFGLYGAEEMHDSQLVQAPQAAEWRRTARQIASDAESFIHETGLDGTVVEYKDLAVSIHYRQRPEPEPPSALYEWASKVAGELGFRMGVGRRVLELKPGSVSKAATFERLAGRGRVRNAVVAGDDSADVEMMQRAGEVIPGCLLRIAIASGESPKGLEEFSDLRLDGPPELIEFLRRFY